MEEVPFQSTHVRCSKTGSLFREMLKVLKEIIPFLLQQRGFEEDILYPILLLHILLVLAIVIVLGTSF
jgi:hypothetical protein